MDHKRSSPDTAETRLDAAADAVTIKQFAADPDAETHQLDPRYFAPLRVCPQCSLAWETDADWCASCGTAFDARDRETVTRVRPGRTGERTAGRSPRARSATASNTRNTGGRAAAHPAARNPRAHAVAPPAKRRSAGSFIGALALFLLIPVAVLAFVAGQNTRPSSAEVNAQIATATQQTKTAALNSFQRNFDRQRAKLQAEFEKRAKAAQQAGYAQGKANAEANLPATSLPQDLKRCLSNFLLNC